MEDLYTQYDLEYKVPYGDGSQPLLSFEETYPATCPESEVDLCTQYDDDPESLLASLAETQVDLEDSCAEINGDNNTQAYPFDASVLFTASGGGNENSGSTTDSVDGYEGYNGGAETQWYGEAATSHTLSSKRPRANTVPGAPKNETQQKTNKKLKS